MSSVAVESFLAGMGFSGVSILGLFMGVMVLLSVTVTSAVKVSSLAERSIALKSSVSILGFLTKGTVLFVVFGTDLISSEVLPLVSLPSVQLRSALESLEVTRIGLISCDFV